jgi:hypothetical protein
MQEVGRLEEGWEGKNFLACDSEFFVWTGHCVVGGFMGGIEVEWDFVGVGWTMRVPGSSRGAVDVAFSWSLVLSIMFSCRSVLMERADGRRGWSIGSAGDFVQCRTLLLNIHRGLDDPLSARRSGCGMSERLRVIMSGKYR